MTGVPEKPTRQFLAVVRGLEFTPKGKLVELEPCDDAIAVLVWSFNNHRDAVSHIDFAALTNEESTLFYSMFTARMNEVLLHLEGLDRRDVVTVQGNTTALVSRSNGDGFYPQVLSDTTYVSGCLERLVVAQVPDQAGMDLIRLEIDNEDGEMIIADNITLEDAGLAMAMHGVTVVSDDPDVTPIAHNAMVLVPIHYDGVIVHRLKRLES